MPSLDELSLQLDQRLTVSARAVWDRRYLARDADGLVCERPIDLLHRVAQAIAQAETKFGRDPAPVAARYLELMAAGDFLPNSPTLMNAGLPLGQLSACFVVPVADSMEGIFDAIKWTALIQKSGGGTGFSFSRLRSSGSRVSTTSGVASGPLPFMDVFNVATDTVVQGGRRRGANMGILRCDHPDVLEFIHAKRDLTRLTNFNLSVAVTDRFMAALENSTAYDLIDPVTGTRTRSLDAKAVWQELCRLACETAEPGVVFIDRINEKHTAKHLGAIESTNPCGEQPLLPFESCVLGSINLRRFIREPIAPATNPSSRSLQELLTEVDWSRLKTVVADGVRFLDSVIEENRYPLPQIREATLRSRKIGLGVMGLADLLIALGVPYDDERAVELGGALMEFIERESVAASRLLAEERGPCPAFVGSSWDGTGAPLRNLTTTTVAPTGTISILAGCSSGIEPLYALQLTRTVLDGTQLFEVDAAFVRAAAAAGCDTAKIGAILAETGRLSGGAASDVPSGLQRLFVTAHDIAPEWHVKMQAIFQKHCHAAVSKTINLPSESTAADVDRVYRLAYRLGCKGVTVYRDGSRAGQVLSSGKQPASVDAALPCPECGAPLAKTEQCWLCYRCGYARC